MIKSLLILLLISGTICKVAAQIKITGLYKGRNLYVQNPYHPSGDGFCVSSVLVNQHTMPDTFHQSQAFEVRFDYYGYKINDSITVVINYLEGCEPRILNPEVLPKPLPYSPFNPYIFRLRYNKQNASLEWKFRPDSIVHQSLTFEIQQFKWDKWNSMGEISCRDTCKFTPFLHSGPNWVRLMYVNAKGEGLVHYRVRSEFPF